MIEFQINKETLDLVPGTTTTINSSSPFFSTDAITGEYSLPVQFGVTEKNLRLLGYVTEIPVIKSSTRISNVDYSEDGLHFYKGTLVVEYAQGNLNGKPGGVLSGYFLLGTSNFWQAIKNKRLRDLNLGGDRTFSWAGFDRDADGFWKHIHDTWTATSDQMDYVFAPIVDEKWEGDDSQADFMNKIHVSGAAAELESLRNWNSLVAHPYYIYLLKSIFSEHDYRLSGRILKDNGFKRLYMPSMMSIYWCKYDVENDVIDPIDEVTINVAKQLPDVTISDFLISLGNKFGWGYEFSRSQRSCEIKLFRDIPNDSRREEYSNDIQPAYKISFPVTPDVISLTQTFDGQDEAVGSIDFNAVSYKGEIQSQNDFPATPNVGDGYLVIDENIYYAYVSTDDSAGIGWNKIGDNIYDYVQENQTKNIETSITTCAMRYLKYDTVFAVDHYSFFPEIKRIGNWKIVTFRKPSGRQPGYGPRMPHNSPAVVKYLAERAAAYRRLTGPTESFNNWSMRMLFFWGMQRDKQNIHIPYSANHNFDNNGNQIGDWSLAYKQGTFGLVDKFWQLWLKVLQSNERLSATIYPKLYRFLQMKWSDILLIRNTPYMIQQKTVNGPYNNKLQITGYRMPSLSKGKSTVSQECPDCSVATNLNVTLLSNNSVEFTFSGDEGYDYRVEWSNNQFLSVEGSLTISAATPDPNGTVTATSPVLPTDGSTRQWRVVHINCGSTCQLQGSYVTGPEFSTQKSTLEVNFKVYPDPSDARRILLDISISEAADRDLVLEGSAFLYAVIALQGFKINFNQRLTAGLLTKTFTIYTNPTFSLLVKRYCYSSAGLFPRRGDPDPVVVQVHGDRC